MKKDKWDTLILHKNYLAKGMSELSWFRYLTYLFGVTGALTGALDFRAIVVIGVGFITFSYIFGMTWDRFGLYHKEAEFNNERNYFVKEMRKMEERLTKLIGRIK